MRIPSISTIARGFVTLVIFMCLGLLVILKSSSSNLIGLTTDVSRYSEILEGYGDSPLVQHFPRTIPSEAENVKLQYLPRVFQGGEHFQLRLKLPAEEINRLYEKFDTVAIYKFEGGNSNIHSDLTDGVPTTYFYTNNDLDDDRSFPDSYEILVLEAKPAGSVEQEWNHGYTYGVAIDITASEIVYWSEYW